MIEKIRSSIIVLCVFFAASVIFCTEASYSQEIDGQRAAVPTSDPNWIASGFQGRLEKVERITDELNDFIMKFIYVFFAVAVIIPVSGFVLRAIYRPYLHEKLRNYVNYYLNSYIDSRIEEDLPKLLQNTQKNAERYLLRLAGVLVLRDQEKYDLALRQYEWNGQVSSLRDEAPALRRTIIECLYASPLNRIANREAAWHAVTELSETDKSVETHRLYLKLSCNLNKHEEGLRYFSKNEVDIIADRDAANRAATILRHLSRLEEAKNILDKIADDKDIDTIVNLSAINRDLGNFPEVHRKLLPMIDNLIKADPGLIPKGALRLFNTFIANCIDRGHPEDAVSAGKYILSSKAGSVEAFTVARLSLKLPDGDDRSYFVQKLSVIVQDLIHGEAALRCKVLLLVLNQQVDEAIRILDQKISSIQSNRGMDREEYYFRCTLAELYIAKDDVSNAINVLRPAAMQSFGGEAKFILARAYSLERDGTEAGRWLSDAVRELPKWRVLAQADSVLRRDPKAMERI